MYIWVCIHTLTSIDNIDTYITVLDFPKFAPKLTSHAFFLS